MNFVDLPPLNALRVFEAAARHGSFVQAATELCVTHGAVSRQIRLLEERLGVALFVRRNRAVFLSREGERLFAACGEALGTLQRALHELVPQQAPPLAVSCEPTLAMRWLIPRLPRFHARYPDIEVHLSAAGGAVALETGHVALAIRRDDFAWPVHYCVQRLAAEYVGPVQRPAGGAAVRLHTRSRAQAWPTWLRLRPTLDLALSGEREFEHFYLSVQAATAGLGVAMASLFMVADDLAAQTLAAPAGFVADGSHYVLLSLQPLALDERQQAFADWLALELQQTLQQGAALMVAE